MKRIYIFILSLLAISCEMIFDIEYENGKNRFLIACVPSAGDEKVEIHLSLARSVSAPVEEPLRPEDIDLRLFADGKSIPVKYDRTNGPQFYYISEFPIRAGQDIRIEARADNYETAYSEIEVPQPPVLASDIMVENILLTSDPLYGTCEVSFIDNPETEDIYGLMLWRTKTSSADVPSLHTPCAIDLNVDSFVFPDKYEVDLNVGQMIFWKESASSQEQTIKLDIITLESSAKGDPFIYRPVIYRLSPELYRYCKGQWDMRNNFVSTSGFSPATFAYTNIVGGIGILGAMSPVTGPWFNIGF
ncbi:MAG: DUF4249 domain-containing protein [Bacteroidales bacterium]|nr:DUF4249 domain-containing protein [Bacteroidales bacterium]